MVNFILQYHLLEDKSDRPYECEWCGDNFGGHKRKYCTPKCREEEKRYEASKEKLERHKRRQEKILLKEQALHKKKIKNINVWFVIMNLRAVKHCIVVMSVAN